MSRLSLLWTLSLLALSVFLHGCAEAPIRPLGLATSHALTNPLDTTWRGVRVRGLVDDADMMAGDEKLLELDGYRDMQVRVFNSFSYRGHNKILRNLDFAFHKQRLDYEASRMTRPSGGGCVT